MWSEGVFEDWYRPHKMAIVWKHYEGHHRHLIAIKHFQKNWKIFRLLGFNVFKMFLNHQNITYFSLYFSTNISIEAEHPQIKKFQTSVVFSTEIHIPTPWHYKIITTVTIIITIVNQVVSLQDQQLPDQQVFSLTIDTGRPRCCLRGAPCPQQHHHAMHHHYAMHHHAMPSTTPPRVWPACRLTSRPTMTLPSGTAVCQTFAKQCKGKTDLLCIMYANSDTWYTLYIIQLQAKGNLQTRGCFSVDEFVGASEVGWK